MQGLAATKMGMKQGKSAVAEIVGILMRVRTYSHLAHLKTSSYSKHTALNEFYESIVDFADRLAEVAQGKFGKLDIPALDVKGNVDKPIDILMMNMEELLGLSDACGNGAMKNIVDEVEALFLSTLYKLRELD